MYVLHTLPHRLISLVSSDFAAAATGQPATTRLALHRGHNSLYHLLSLSFVGLDRTLGLPRGLLQSVLVFRGRPSLRASMLETEEKNEAAKTNMWGRITNDLKLCRTT